MRNLAKVTIKGKHHLESKFTTAYLKEWRETHGNWGHKLTDLARTQKPFDAILADEFWIYTIEFKMIDKNILKVSDFEPWQIKAWRKLSELWQNTFAIVYSKSSLLYCVIDFRVIIEAKDQGNMEIDLFKNNYWDASNKY